MGQARGGAAVSSAAPKARLLWFALLAPGAAFLLNLQILYLLVTLACDRAGVWLHLTALLSLGLALAAGAIAWRARPPGISSDDGGYGRLPRNGFLAGLGVLSSALFALLIVAQWIAIWVQPLCSDL